MSRRICMLGVAVVLSGGVVAGCGDGRRGVPEALVPTQLPVAHTTTIAQAPAGAGLQILVPRPGKVVSARFTARVAVSGLAVGNPREGDRVGSLRFSLDGGRYDEPQFSGADGRAAVRLAVNGFYSPSEVPEITYSEIPAGRHVLQVSLVNHDGALIGVSRQVTFTVR